MTLQCAKRGVLSTLKGLGVFRLARESRWRQQRLLILCYHGISLDDEHEWNGSLYMKPSDFEQRLEMLRRGGYTVLPLAEGLQRLYRRDLPPKSVVITFDDGTHDFYARAYPIVKRYGYPVTVYLTTYYCYDNRPVFPGICSYMLWKKRDARLDLASLLGREGWVELSAQSGREIVCKALQECAFERGLSADGKHELAAKLAEHLGLDYGDLTARRLVHVMNPAEVAEVSRGGVDVQLHTHRHRTPLDRDLFLREIRENRSHIHELTQSDPTHFCYPSGVHRREFLPWLSETGVVSATTCEVDLATCRSMPLLLPRLVDTAQQSPVQVESWLVGLGSLLPRRATEEGVPTSEGATATLRV